MKIPYNILIQIKMSVRPYFKGFTLIFFFYNCRKQDYIIVSPIIQQGHLTSFMIQNFFILQHKKKEIFFQISFALCSLNFYPIHVKFQFRSGLPIVLQLLLSQCHR